MSNNTKIYSEAIAEAKSIRETAMANAKLALEEAFAPRMQEMMSNKLEALAEEMEEEEVNENTEGDSMEEISLEELIAELDGLEEGHAEPDADNYGGPSDHDADNLNEEAEDEDAVGEITVDELKDIIRGIMNDVMETEEESGEEEGEEEEAPEGEEELSLDEILAELDSLNENEEMEEDLEEGVRSALKGAVDKFDKWIGSTSDKMTAAGQKSKAVQAATKGVSAAQSAVAPKGYSSGALYEEDEDIEESIGSALKGAVDKFDKWIGSTSDKMTKAGQGSKAVQAATRGVSAAQSAVTPKGYNTGAKYESVELQEALKTISVLRSSLNEVNLLNAKLLYVNKLFKGRNLTEAQKVKVINAFDRAETVKETKNIFETLKESFTTTKNPIKESLSFASKAAGVAPNRQPIVEGDEFMKRMQKIAGII